MASENEREELWRTQTNSGDDSSGVAFGFEGDLFIPVAISCFISVTLFSVILISGMAGIIGSFLWAFLPVGASVSYVVLLRHKKPKHYDIDLMEELVTAEDGCRRLTRQPLHPRVEAAQIDSARKTRDGHKVR